ncbi:MAG: DUF3617 family protein [Xanthobacteraceae bacterium]
MMFVRVHGRGAPVFRAFALIAPVFLVFIGAPAALADGIEPGLWKITAQTKGEGMVSPPHESAKCLTEDETKDLATTFSPVPRMINSECSPIERKLGGARLDWRLVCKGQLNVELTGAFNFDSAHHYTATVHTQAAIGGQTMDTLDTLEGQWVSAACQ